jgi:AcrR family transcriptional regulator
MGIAERREREREELRTRIVEAARDILSDEGLDALSIRSIAERIEYSPATIYLYFRDKDELIREVVKAGVMRLAEYIEQAVAELGPDANPADQFRVTGRAYARFAVENTAYFRVMFELPKVPRMDCLPPAEADPRPPCDADLVALVTRAKEAGLMKVGDPAQAALIGWGAMHGLASLYLSGHLAPEVQGPEQFAELIEVALVTLWEGWKVEGAGDPEVDRRGRAAAAKV